MATTVAEVMSRNPSAIEVDRPVADAAAPARRVGVRMTRSGVEA
jgi:hypothetical protein